jgi:hypothetical protein
MSKQDIEKRLGFAAQGVKETTRTNAKAAFASPKYRAFVYRGSPSNNVLVKATEFMDSASAAEDAAKQIVMSFRGKPGYPSNNYFADIAQETPEGAKTVKNNIRFSRPGVKAKMGLEMNMLDFRHKFFTAFGTAIRDAKSNPNTAEAQSDEAVLRESWASMFAQGYSDAISDLNGLSATMKSKTSVGQMRKAASDAMEAYRQAKAAVRSSRPGVKAKA